MLSQLIAEQSITHVTLPPSALTIMQPENLPDLKTLIVAGEACPIQLPRLWARHFRFINAYGPTETTVCAAAGVLEHDIDTVHIGRPIANTTVYLLDEFLQPVPTGAIGEVYIGGTGIARGYINRPALTAERFVPDRFSRIAGSRLFKTGDMARYLPDGRIEFLGRRDYQVKIRGFRIELGEIETALMSHPQLGPCVVGVEGEGEDKRLVAFCTSKQAKDLSVETMRLFLEQRLSDYMIPSAFVYLESLPKTPSGKIDRNELLRMAKPAKNDTRQYTAPRDPIEEALAAIWSKLLNLSPVSIHDNFFHCGGHSLKAVKLVDEVEKKFGPVPMASIFQAPTVAQFAAILKQGRQRTEFPFIVELNSHGDEPPLFCVHPANGSIACYAELARLQNGKRKVYAFQPPELSSESLLEDAVHSLAKMYAEGIQASTAAEQLQIGTSFLYKKI
jgi:aryl carrier-like protein